MDGPYGLKWTVLNVDGIKNKIGYIAAIYGLLNMDLTN